MILVLFAVDFRCGVTTQRRGEGLELNHYLDSGISLVLMLHISRIACGCFAHENDKLYCLFPSLTVSANVKEDL